MELAVDQVLGRGNTLQALDPRGSGKSVDPRLGHEDRHQPRADLDVHRHRQLRMDTAVAVGAAGRDMDLADEASQPLPAQLSRRQRTPLVAVVALTGDPKHPAGDVDGHPGIGQSIDHRVNPFGCGLS